jgi:hypothetical protein
MTALRRESGGIALVLAYVLVLQSLAAGLMLGSMAGAQAGPLAGPLAVICAAKGPLTIAPDADPGTPANFDPHSPCATLCQLASAASCLPGPEGGYVSPLPPPGNAGAIALAPAETPRRALAGLVAEARAPPFSI